MHIQHSTNTGYPNSDYPKFQLQILALNLLIKKIITLCHLYNIKHKPRTSHAPWTNRLVEGMNRSLQE